MARGCSPLILYVGVFVAVLQVRGFACQGHLNAGRSPWNERNVAVGVAVVTFFAYPLKGLVNLSWINVVALNDIQNRNVATIPLSSHICRDHNVFCLSQSSHDVQHCCFSNAGLIEVRVLSHSFIQLGKRLRYRSPSLKLCETILCRN